MPSFARAVAAELRSASDRAAAGFADPPADAETFAFTSLAAFPAAANAEDPAAAEALLARALAVSLPSSAYKTPPLLHCSIVPTPRT